MVQDRRPAHVIVLGNEKGGSGKSTTAMHVIVALLKSGARVASIDTDGRQRSLTRYIENRAVWKQKSGLALELPTHFTVPHGEGETVSDIEGREFRAFAEAVSRTEYGYDYVVVDTAGSNTYLMRVSHAMADTLVTPINDSFVDFDVLARVDPETFAVIGPSHYAELVGESRRQRQLIDSRGMDWVVVRNRLSPIQTRNRKKIDKGLRQLADKIGFRVAKGIGERVVYRELFPRGLTALDALDRQTLGGEPTLSHVSARDEIRSLLENLNLPRPRGASEAGPAASRPGAAGNRSETPPLRQAG
ncbi:MAG: division plane positioning ATPase MipZ [Bauldia sp.]|jgi:chromosome partitioning protein|nr:division plane positioning ATPase MipZ [Bauldia sp.]